ncbi:MAG: molybdopterin molybdotransferase MoeA [Bacteroidales bacterium]|nr:molybdopterin molybdotransferase MoeA [Bacteroidales bacterium]
MIDFHIALQTVLDNATRTKTEDIPLENACDRILALGVAAPTDMPPFSKSAMDGYACRREDTERGMKKLEVIAAGDIPKHEITPGTCSKIMTGALVPQGADCVLIVENATLRDELVFGPPPATDNIILRGEDLKKGEPVLTAGTLLRPQHLSLLASCGITQVTVSKKITVGILSTGDELVEPGHSMSPGKVFNSNSWQLMAMVQQMGGIPTYYGIAKDSLLKTQDLLMEALEANHVILLTGGVSEGDFDCVPVVIQDLGFEILFDRVRIQPGKPTTFAISRSTGQFIFGLPGNPVSSFVQCLLMVFPFLAAMQGAHWEPLTTYFPLKEDYKRRRSVRMGHIPVRINPDGTCSPVPYNGSAHQAALSEAHGLGRIPVGTDTIKAGDPMQVLLFY